MLVLADARPDGVGLHRLTFDRALPDHTTPGQFVAVRLGEHKPAFFAIASEPGAPVELLVKAQGDAALALVALPIGAEVSVSDTMGKGFGLSEGDADPLVILVNGSGISAVRGLIEAEVARGLPRAVHLLYGVFTPGHAAYAERLDAWRSAGVDARLVVSDPVPDWSGDRGFVQHVAKDRGLVRPDVTVLLVGFPAMIEDAKAMWSAVGAAPERLRTNY